MCQRLSQGLVDKLYLTPSLTLNSELQLNIKPVTFPSLGAKAWSFLPPQTSFRPFFYLSLSSTATPRSSSHLPSFYRQKGRHPILAPFIHQVPPAFPEAPPPSSVRIRREQRQVAKYNKSTHHPAPTPQVHIPPGVPGLDSCMEAR